MKFSSVSDKFFNSYKHIDSELLNNENERRPYLIIIKLKFNGKNQDFAIPFRSNLPNHAPKEHYFSLPPRSTTKQNCMHVLHFLKMFPIKKEYLIKFHVKGNPEYERLLSFINKNLNKIITKAQSYLNEYQKGNKASFSTNIDMLYLALHGIVPAEVEAAPLKEKKSGDIE